MILGNKAILEALRKKRIKISGLTGRESPKDKPFNTSAVDLRLHQEIAIPTPTTAAIDLTEPGIASFLSKISTNKEISEDSPYVLRPNRFILARTLEEVDFPILKDYPRYSARVEGRSSLARWGILIHFTAPTIHAGFMGPIFLCAVTLLSGVFDAGWTLLPPKNRGCE